MKTQPNKTNEKQARLGHRSNEPGPNATATIEDHRPKTVYQRQLRKTMDAHAAAKAAPLQRKANHTGLPDNLKAGIEHLSGYAMDDVKVHYNSAKPARLRAHAYAQGTDIHLAPGQEKHLPHEAWHVVQQKQGRIRPTMQFKAGVNINDDAGLEREADVMGAKVIQEKNSAQIQTLHLHTATIDDGSVIQGHFYDSGQVITSYNELEIYLRNALPNHYAQKDIEALVDLLFQKKQTENLELKRTLNLNPIIEVARSFPNQVLTPQTLLERAILDQEGHAIDRNLNLHLDFGDYQVDLTDLIRPCASDANNTPGANLAQMNTQQFRTEIGWNRRDYKGVDLTNVNFAELSGVDFDGFDFDGVTFSGSFVGISFTRTKFHRCTFSNAVINDTKFQYAELYGVQFYPNVQFNRRTSFKGSRIDETSLLALTWIQPGHPAHQERENRRRDRNPNPPPLKRTDEVNFDGAILILHNTTILRNINLTGVDFRKGSLPDRNFEQANLQGANLQRANLQRLNLKKAKLQGANLQGADLQGAKLQKANLENADLQGAKLQAANLRETNLKEVFLQGADLYRLNLTNTVLAGANFMGANLREANLQGVNFQEGQSFERTNLAQVNFQRATLNQAIFQYAFLREAQFQGANLKKADFAFAKLQDTNLQRATFIEAQVPGNRVMPALFNHPLPDRDGPHGEQEMGARNIRGHRRVRAYRGVDLGYFYHTNLSGADFRGAVLDEAAKEFIKANGGLADKPKSGGFKMRRFSSLFD